MLEKNGKLSGVGKVVYLSLVLVWAQTHDRNITFLLYLG